MPLKEFSMMSFKSFSKLTLVSIFLIIIAGSVVRMTGSGMGCPDWPKCFGLIIPPSSVDQIEWKKNTAYQSGQMIIYADQLWEAESDFFTKDVFDGGNWSLYTKHDYAKFNVAHTWTEYINRLIGAVSGVLTFIMMIWSFKYWYTKRKISYLSILIVLLMGFQAWLGAVVVYSVLQPMQITIHMLMALVIIVLMMYLINEVPDDTNNEAVAFDKSLYNFVLLAVFLSVIQILLGTEVRQQIDLVSKSLDYSQRELWIGQTDIWFKIHRSFAILLVVTNVLLWLRSKQINYSIGMSNAILIVVIIEAISGIVLSYFDMMPLMQPIHLLAASLLFVLQMGLLFRLRNLKTI